MGKTQEIRSIISRIKGVKAELAEQIEKIHDDPTHSDLYKQTEMGMAESAAQAALEEIWEEAEEIIDGLEELVNGTAVFDYGNPRLLAAVQFIQANSGSVPEAAVKQMLSDFAGKPAELQYLSGFFEKHGALDAAIAASEAAKHDAVSLSLPKRLSDAVFYVTHQNPDARCDFGGFESELALLEDQVGGEE